MIKQPKASRVNEKAATAPFKSGFVAIAGQPNTGKSTFLNMVLGQKVAIVTPKAQTTRTRILGVCHRPNCQIILLDTPGIHRPGASLFNKAMVRTAYETCREGELILYFIDGTRGLNDADRTILERLQPTNNQEKQRPVLLVLNKVDRLPEPLLFARLQALQEIPCVAVVPISALTGYNIEHLLSLLPDYLPEGPHYFPEEQWTDQPEQFFAAEVIREKLFLHLQKELPYSLAVHLHKFQPRIPAGEKEIWDVEATILVERESQKAIVIGQKGSMLKQVGSAARKELEQLFSVPIFLKLWVRVRKEWGEDISLLRNLGYPTVNQDADSPEEDVALG
ncbi:GTPase Era [Candidatus Magnetaquicoccus inordinatus]|uniref:GTPase Era n=1 Tax=Candidatus Magnetaquicoccus inordinatus TaxID=2496818 RepID=UPI001D0F3D6F|nr:GTPase Era [Candidatus Magnetaquicoccus inordinatus]